MIHGNVGRFGAIRALVFSSENQPGLLSFEKE